MHLLVIGLTPPLKLRADKRLRLSMPHSFSLKSASGAGEWHGHKDAGPWGA